MLRCTIEPDLLNRNRPEDSYTMQDMFYIMNIKVCNAGKTLAVLLLCSESANKGIVNGILYSLLSQAVQKFKLFCCQVSLQNYVALENTKRKVIKTFTQNRNYGLLKKKKNVLPARIWLKDFRELFLSSVWLLCTLRRMDLKCQENTVNYFYYRTSLFLFFSRYSKSNIYLQSCCAVPCLL